MEDKCKVIVNAAGVHAIVSVGSKNPAGYKDAGKEGTFEECQAYVDKHEA